MLRNDSNNQYTVNGVSICPSIPSAGDKVTLVYDGLLSKQGATELFAHVGYGNTWDQSGDFRMIRTAEGFEATVPVQHHDQINVAFRDCADNWDNNAGYNYSFRTEQK